ncbi:MAG: hypothetical protein OHM57_07495 [Spiroplasma phoeniceum]|nr:MAG: hypothetical protein OHM57_07495 [Spiroplasma phoeniceum]
MEAFDATSLAQNIYLVVTKLPVNGKKFLEMMLLQKLKKTQNDYPILEKLINTNVL